MVSSLVSSAFEPGMGGPVGTPGGVTGPAFADAAALLAPSARATSYDPRPIKMASDIDNPAINNRNLNSLT
jgi:hypothetical protein